MYLHIRRPVVDKQVKKTEEQFIQALPTDILVKRGIWVSFTHVCACTHNLEKNNF